MPIPNKATWQYIEDHKEDNPQQLILKGKSPKDVNLPLAVQQIAAKQQGKQKLPTWIMIPRLVFPPSLSLEQCSSEWTANYKRKLLKGDSLIDITGGFGIDCAFLSSGFKEVHYVERQADLCTIAAHNFKQLALHQIEIHHQDGIEYLQQSAKVDCLFVDPARRAEGKKQVAIADCEPDVKTWMPLMLSKANEILIKLSPMLDIHQALSELPQAHEVHIVATNNECKELLVKIKQTAAEECRLHCVHLKSNSSHQFFDFTFSQEQKANCLFANEIEDYLYEPNVAILKAGAYKYLAKTLHLKKLHSNTHLYTSNDLLHDFPGRKFKVEDIIHFNKKELRQKIGTLSQANITIRNFPSSVDALRKRFRIKDGGKVYLFATTLQNDEKVVIKCSKC
jgi:16S rRNA G966 N2-methylase RsmD